LIRTYWRLSTGSNITWITEDLNFLCWTA